MAENPFSLEGQVVLVSGAGRGMGLACAKLIAQCGGTVALAARTQSQVEAGAEAIRAAGGQAQAFRIDVGAIERHDAFLDEVEAACGELRGLVNVAGVSPSFARADQLTPEHFDAIQQVNQRGTFFLTQAVAKRWIEREVGGSVVTISSTAARFGLPRLSAYAMSRAAVEAMSKTMAAEWGFALTAPIRVNCVAPGWMATEFTGEIPAWYASKTENHAALRRWGQPEEVAGAVVYLLSEAARFVTGEVIDVSGGYGLWALDPAPARK